MVFACITVEVGGITGGAGWILFEYCFILGGTRSI